MFTIIYISVAVSYISSGQIIFGYKKTHLWDYVFVIFLVEQKDHFDAQINKNSWTNYKTTRDFKICFKRISFNIFLKLLQTYIPKKKERKKICLLNKKCGNIRFWFGNHLYYYPKFSSNNLWVIGKPNNHLTKISCISLDQLLKTLVTQET